MNYLVEALGKIDKKITRYDDSIADTLKSSEDVYGRAGDIIGAWLSSKLGYEIHFVCQARADGYRLTPTTAEVALVNVPEGEAVLVRNNLKTLLDQFNYHGRFYDGYSITSYTHHSSSNKKDNKKVEDKLLAPNPKENRGVKWFLDI